MIIKTINDYLKLSLIGQLSKKRQHSIKIDVSHVCTCMPSLIAE